MRPDDRLAVATLDRYPEVDTRTLAILCGDAWVGSDSFDREWNRRSQEIAVWIAERTIGFLRLVREWVAPEFTDHNSFVLDLARWLDLAGWGTATEQSTKIDPSDRMPKRADLVIGEPDVLGGLLLSAPLIVVEVKSQVRTPGQAKTAAAQVLGYCRGFEREYGDAPIPVVVAGEVGPNAPRFVDGVALASPQEFVCWLGSPAEQVSA